MLQPPVKKVRVVERFADDADAVVAVVCAPGWAERGGGARVIKDTQKVSVLLGEAGGVVGGEVVVKTVRARMFGGTKLQRDVESWGMLIAFDVPVPRYIARLRGRNDSGELVESLVMERTGGHSLLWEIAYGQRTVREEHDLARAVGELTARIVQPTMAFNRDHKPSNIMVERTDTGFAISLIDLDGFTGRQPFVIDSIGNAEKMLSKLAIECIGCGVLPRRAILMRVVDSFCNAYESEMRLPNERTFRVHIWRHITEIIREHGDPTPKDDPLEFDRRMMGLD